ncbi:MAG: nucleoside phosphatase GDA1/CD39 [Piptocephalis tieghemiana]|nr:MAG: nucleoside phosphatase GDA1/CD39 [Piptocephalis tieghemiana]
MVSPKLIFALSLLALPILALAAPKKHEEEEDNDNESDEEMSDSNSDSDSSGKSYGIIMDAGSGGTRAFAYSWSTGSPGKVETIMDKDKPFSVKLKPGLSSLSSGEMEKYMGELIDGVSEVIPKSARAQTTVQLMATAGLRLLPGSKADDIISTVKSILSSSPFKSSPGTAATIISGAQEGVYGWMALNTLSGSLGQSSSIAAIAMGGASTQITFAAPSAVPAAYATTLELGGSKTSLYTHSYLGYGATEVRAKYIDTLLGAGGNSSSVRDPCGLEGNSVKGTSSKGNNVTLTGTGNVKECMAALRATLDLQGSCAQEPCAVQGAFQPEIPSDMKIQATNNFADLAKAFKCDSEDSSIQCLLDATAKTCPSMSVDEAKDEWSKDMDDPSLVCFQGMYAAVILQDGFHIAPDHPITFSDNAGDVKKMTYTLGAMISSLNPSGVSISASE